MELRKSDERGVAEHGWLSSRHTFSFASYFDPEFTGYRDLLVINEDRVQAGKGFGTHAHQDMEIISYVLSGELEHKDSMGNRSVIVPGEVQRMSAGRGVLHSEYNPSHAEPVHFLQIWVMPNQRGLTPSYEQKMFPLEERRDTFRLLLSPDGREGSVVVHQDAELYGAVLSPGGTLRYPRRPGRHLWLQVARGQVQAHGLTLSAGDGLAIDDLDALQLIGGPDDAELLLFDLA